MKRLLVLSSLLLPLNAFAQGTLTPPSGAPVPTQKTLLEIWNKVDALETRTTSLQAQVDRLKSDNQLLSSVLALSPTGIELPWIVSSVAAAGDGQYTSLAFGPDGQPAISHYSTSSASLRISRYDGTNWTTVTVDSGFVGTYSSLAFNSSGQPAIAYYDATNTNLKYASYNGTSWVVETVDNNAGNVGQYASLAFAADGRANIAYYDVTNGDLKFARFNGAFWTTSALISSGDVGSGCSLAIGPDKQPAIVCYDKTLNQIKLGRYNGSSWSFTNDLATSFPTGLSGSCSLAFHYDGTPTYSFYADKARSTFSGNGIFPLFINGLTPFGPDTSLTFGPSGKWAISLYDATNKDLVFTLGHDSTQDTTLVVDATGDVGRFSSIAYGPDGQPAISYYDATNSTLKFARKGIFKPAP